MSSSANLETKLPAHLNPTNWFIGLGTLFFAGLAWWGLGQPGMALKDGYYGCEDPLRLPIGTGATVEGGEVVSVSRPGEEVLGPVQWSNAERTSSRTFRVTVDDIPYVCSFEWE